MVVVRDLGVTTSYRNEKYSEKYDGTYIFKFIDKAGYLFALPHHVVIHLQLRGILLCYTLDVVLRFGLVGARSWQL